MDPPERHSSSSPQQPPEIKQFFLLYYKASPIFCNEAHDFLPEPTFEPYLTLSHQRISQSKA